MLHGWRYVLCRARDGTSSHPAVHPELRVKYQMASARVLVDLQDHLLITQQKHRVRYYVEWLYCSYVWPPRAPRPTWGPCCSYVCHSSYRALDVRASRVTVICYPARYMYMHEGGRAGDGFTYDR
jgi:hypothetical protein